MPAIIVIKTQPTSVTGTEFGIVTFGTTVLSGSAADPQSYLTSSKAWFQSGSGIWTAVAGQTTTTLSLTNIQKADDGKKYVMTVHSASNADSVVTSSAVTLTVTNKNPQYLTSDVAQTNLGAFSHLGYGDGYKHFIALISSSVQVNEKYCPHFACERDMYEFLNYYPSYNTTITNASTSSVAIVSSSYGSSEIAATTLAAYHGLGYKGGYKYFIPLTIGGVDLNEKYCPHFQEERDVYEYIISQTDAKTYEKAIA